LRKGQSPIAHPKGDDAKNLVGQKVISLEFVVEETSEFPVCLVTTEAGDLYVGQWMQVVKQMGKADLEPFVVAKIYRDRYGVCDFFATRCWVIVDVDDNNYELYVTKLDLFADLNSKIINQK
jgi:hypothetical protein